MTFAQMLRARMVALGIRNQADAAEQLGVTATTFSRWIRGRDAPQSARLDAVIQWLDLPAGEVLSAIYASTPESAAIDRLAGVLSELSAAQTELRAEVAALRQELRERP
jgi:transcriptional regulator with XRE-family HTH domain